ncbi:MFS general substrate transporter [Ascoidea rubescens DSM 1968]|uniref:MFS general substrate transporter n=1 Tax=Ascoidea rubescens DSM 1968 TaxID=1344418 RepID=A0A1D2VLK3_9ASCO|nr:MFS general substrate transporter [Ascoidea rubescens DSM 1968]ODV62481.1 MFS general substrate transporter [Ascoidea rubescens DSM 1968]
MDSKSKISTVEEIIKEKTISNDLEKNSPITKPSFDIPDGGYGWVIVFALHSIFMVTWGANSGFAVYLAHYLNEDLFENATKIDYAWIGGLAFGLGLMIAPIITFLVGFFGFKQMMCVGATFEFAAMMLASFSVDLWQLYLTQGALQGLGLAFTFVPSIHLISQWFKKKRTLAMGLVSGGAGTGGILFALAMNEIMVSKNVQWALRSQAIICLVLTMISIVLLKDRSDKIHPEFKPIDSLILKNKGFWINFCWIFFVLLAFVIVQYSISDFTKSLGYSAHQGSVVAAIVSLGALVLRPIFGIASDRFGPATVTCLVYFTSSILCFAMWISCRNYATDLAFGFFIGGLMGFIWPALGSIIPRTVGLRKTGVCYGMHWIAIGILGIVSPVIGLVLRGPVNESNNYVNPTAYVNPAIFCGSMFFGASFFLFLLRAFLIARDSLSEKDADSDHSQELLIVVPWSLVLKSMFILNPSKKA